MALGVEFADELADGAKAAALPLIRGDLHLGYPQLGLLIAVPLLVGGLVELPLGLVAGGGARRNRFVLTGGVVFAASLAAVAAARTFPVLLVALVVFFPASGAFVSLTQAALMDAGPARQRQHMAAWNLAGSCGDVCGPLLLAGHSMGGLVTALYAHEGKRRAEVQALWLNSAFFDWNLADWRKVHLHVAAAIGRYYPFLSDSKALRPEYTRTLLTEWEFDTRLKPEYGFPLYCGWLAAISDAFEKLHRGLQIECPVLSMHSDGADVVLDWRHIARWSRSLGPNVTVLAFPGAWHDLVLSPGRIREEVFSQLFAWAERAVVFRPEPAREARAAS